MALTMADKTIEEFLLKQGYNPFPLIRYTERADIAATHILEGHVIIYVDTSPSVIITPTTIISPYAACRRISPVTCGWDICSLD